MNHLEHSLQDDFKYRGVWWLPENPDYKLAGELSYADEGISLELVGSFRPLETIGGSETFQVAVILGITTDGKACTLLQNAERSFSLSHPGLYCQRIMSRYLFMGHHFSTEEDVQFSSYKVNYMYLEEWIGQRAFDLETLEDDGKFSGYEVHYKPTTLVEIYLNSVNGTLRTNYFVRVPQDAYRKLALNHRAFLELCPEAHQHFEWFRRLFFDIQNLLTLLVGEPTYPTMVHGAVETQSEKEASSRKWISIYTWQSRLLLNKKLLPSEMLVPLPSIQSRASEIFEAWLINANRLRSVYDLFFGSLYKPDLYIQFKFLGLIQALESFHRATKVGKYLEDVKYEQYYRALVSALPNDMPNDLRSALSGRLRYGNQYSLRRRLREIFIDLGDDLTALVCQDSKQFTDEVVATRNYLTHYDEDEKVQNPEPQKLLFMWQRLRILLTIVLLNSISIDKSTIRERISNNERFHPWD